MVYKRIDPIVAKFGCERELRIAIEYDLRGASSGNTLMSFRLASLPA